MNRRRKCLGLISLTVTLNSFAENKKKQAHSHFKCNFNGIADFRLPKHITPTRLFEFPVALVKHSSVMCGSALPLLDCSGVWGGKKNDFGSHQDFLHPTRPSSCRIFRVPQSSFCPWRRDRRLSWEFCCNRVKWYYYNTFFLIIYTQSILIKDTIQGLDKGFSIYLFSITRPSGQNKNNAQQHYSLVAGNVNMDQLHWDPEKPWFMETCQTRFTTIQTIAWQLTGSTWNFGSVFDCGWDKTLNSGANISLKHWTGQFSSPILT